MQCLASADAWCTEREGGGSHPFPLPVPLGHLVPVTGAANTTSASAPHRYIERKAFLERVDHRQFEIERDIRLSRMKP